MVKFLLASHGKFSEGTYSFLKIMVGETSNVSSLVCFEDDRSIEELVSSKLKEIGSYDQLIVLCDLYGGSVAQEVWRQTTSDPKVKIIAGYNLALVMDLLLKNKELSDEEIEASIRESRQAIVFLDDLSSKKQIQDDLF